MNRSSIIELLIMVLFKSVIFYSSVSLWFIFYVYNLFVVVVYYFKS